MATLAPRLLLPSALTLGGMLSGALGALASWAPLGAFVLFAVPKKRVSKSRSRIRRAGQLAQSGPRLVTNAYSCPACGEQKLPHRVCGRPDCSTLLREHNRRAAAASPPQNDAGPSEPA
ncbi:hypothetical protein KFE25_012590 [Diacronema lutheri]|uniref:Large ribosomal subunit protein bL32m n=1 Tax=Diacronema lutheri TaxID=2081491 RepID=A0A8J5XNK1_DIALT|nr:hypothetical protein KFE25_012590 [Diacronema lutheri]